MIEIPREDTLAGALVEATAKVVPIDFSLSISKR